MDDDIITGLARNMPKLKTLKPGTPPCSEIPTGVTVRGLAVLAHHCPDLSTLRVHFQVASLSARPAVSGVSPIAESVAPRGGCALKELEVGEMPVPDRSVLVVALTLVHIFPHITRIDGDDENWYQVVDAIRLSREIVNCSGEEHTLLHPEVTLVTPHPPRSHTELIEKRSDASYDYYLNYPTSLSPNRSCTLFLTRLVPLRSVKWKIA